MRKMNRTDESWRRGNPAREIEYALIKSTLLGDLPWDGGPAIAIKLDLIRRSEASLNLQIAETHLDAVTRWIDRYGMIAPLVVTPITPPSYSRLGSQVEGLGEPITSGAGQEPPTSEYTYELVADYASYEALRRLKIEQVPCTVRFVTQEEATAAVAFAFLTHGKFA